MDKNKLVTAAIVGMLLAVCAVLGNMILETQADTRAILTVVGLYHDPDATPLDYLPTSHIMPAMYVVGGVPCCETMQLGAEKAIKLIDDGQYMRAHSVLNDVLRTTR